MDIIIGCKFANNSLTVIYTVLLLANDSNFQSTT